MCMSYLVGESRLHRSWASYTRADAPAYISLPHLILAGGFRKCSSQWRKQGPMSAPTWMSRLVTSRVSCKVASLWRMPWLLTRSKPTPQGRSQGIPS